jgi:hypothetical protein
MAITSPNPALFDPDALEQIYAKGTQMPGGMGGLQYLLGYGAKLGRENTGRDYLGALQDTNRLEAIMGSKKIAADLQKSRMDNSRHLAERGYLPSGLTGGTDLFTDPAGSDAFAKLLQEEIRSKIFANMNKGSGGGGAGGKPTTTVQIQQPGFNMPGLTTITSKNADPTAAYDASQAALARVKAGLASGEIPDAKKAKEIMIQLMMQQGNARNPGIE